MKDLWNMVKKYKLEIFETFVNMNSGRIDSLMEWFTDCGDTMAKSLILCGPNSNPNSLM